MPTTTAFATYPTSYELEYIEQQNLPSLAGQNPIDEILPPISKNAAKLIWEQEDNYSGLTQARGLNGTPLSVLPVGLNQYETNPGYYGEQMVVDEAEMTLRRQYGSPNMPIDVQDLVVRRGNQLLHRQNRRRWWLGWQLVVNGSFSVAHPATQAVVHTDSYTQRIYAAINHWSDHVNSTPLQDLRNIQLLSRGYSINLGATAMIYLQRVDVNNLLSNTNQSDLGGKRTLLGLSNVLSLGAANQIFAGEDLPMIKIWDGGFYSDGLDGYVKDSFNQDIPLGVGVVVGHRLDGSKIGNWVFTKNMVNPAGTPGAYYKVVEKPDYIPPTVQVHRGFNGGHQLLFPSALVKIAV